MVTNWEVRSLPVLQPHFRYQDRDGTPRCKASGTQLCCSISIVGLPAPWPRMLHIPPTVRELAIKQGIQSSLPLPHHQRLPLPTIHQSLPDRVEVDCPVSQRQQGIQRKLRVDLLDVVRVPSQCHTQPRLDHREVI